MNAKTEKIARTIRDYNRNGTGRRPATVIGVNPEHCTAELAFSSERAEVPRWFGIEVLGHAPGEVRLQRLNDGGPLLMDHNRTDQIGVIENARIDPDGTGRATVRFGKSSRAKEMFQDVTDGIRRHVSVGYVIHAMNLTDTRHDSDIYRITDWEPTEISLVSVPADHSVGVGRELPDNTVTSTPQKPDTTGVTPSPSTTEENMTSNTIETSPQATQTDLQNARDQAIKAERQRVAAIVELGREYDAHDLAAEFAANPNGTTEALSRALLERQGKTISVPSRTADMGMSQRDLRQYSILRIVRALSDPTNRKLQDAAGFEREISEEAAKFQRNQDGSRWVVPVDVLRHNVLGNTDMFRDGMNIGSNGQTGPGSTGGATVATTLLAGSYIETLRNRTVFTKGVRILGGLIGNVDIPKQKEATQGYWIGEGDDAILSTMDFGTISLSPKTAAAYTDITRRFLMQSSLDIEALIRADLAKSMALRIDQSGYYGKGSQKEPLGLANMPGINLQEYEGSMPSYAELIDMETTVALQNADVEGMRFKARPDFRGLGKQTLKFPKSAGSSTIWEPNDTVNGYTCDISNQVRRGDIFFGNFSDIIMGMWGGLEMTVDPYSLSKSGSVRVVTFQDIDWAARRTESFIISRPKTSTKSSS